MAGVLHRLAAQRLKSARALERADEPLLALRTYRQTASNFNGLAQGDEARIAANARLTLTLTSVRLTEMAMKLAEQDHLEEAEAFDVVHGMIRPIRG